jgi:alpha-galactosidase
VSGPPSRPVRARAAAGSRSFAFASIHLMNQMPAPPPLLLLAAVLLLGGGGAAALDNGLCRTPPLGWNSWGHFRGGTSAALLAQQADEMVALGLRDAGYSFVNTDDLWLELERGPDGRLVPGKNFGGPSDDGMKNLSAYIHSRGLKFGVYGAAGETTCAKRAGNLYHERQDAAQMASWGIDFFKCLLLRAGRN